MGIAHIYSVCYISVFQTKLVGWQFKGKKTQKSSKWIICVDKIKFANKIKMDITPDFMSKCKI